MLDQFISWIKTHKSSIKTQNTYIYEVEKFFLHYTEFNQSSFNSYMASLANVVSAATYNKIGYALRSYVDFLNDNSQPIVNFVGITAKRVKRANHPYLTLKEFKQGLVYFPEIFKQFHVQILRCEVMFYTGMRAYEMANIKRHDIDLSKGTIFVNVTKGMTPRIVSIPDDLIPKVKNYFALYPETTSAFDCTEATLTYICSTYNAMVSPIKKWHPHIFRHAFCHYMNDIGMPINEISKLMGHENISTTQLYLATTNEAALETYRRLVNQKRNR